MFCQIVKVIFLAQVILAANRCPCYEENQACLCNKLGICPSQAKILSLYNYVDFTNIFPDDCQLDSFKRVNFFNVSLDKLNSVEFLKSFKNLRVISIEKSENLKYLQDKLFTSFADQLEELAIMQTSIKTLNTGVFENLTSIRKLNLTNNKIGFIGKKLFESCKNLELLDLSGNMLTVLNGDTFSGLSHLNILNLAENPIQNITKDAFDPFRKGLKQLTMRHDDTLNYGGFDSFSDGLFSNMNSMTKLKIIEMKLSSLKENDFKSMENLEMLSLRGNRIKQLPKAAFKSLVKLTELDLSGNLLECLPNKFGDLFSKKTNLDKIDLSYNRLSRIEQDTLANFDSAPIVDLSANMIQSVHDFAFCQLNRIVLKLGPPPLVPVFLITSAKFYWEARNTYPSGPFKYLKNKNQVIGMLVNKTNIESIPCPDLTPDTADSCSQETVVSLSWSELKKLKVPEQYLMKVQNGALQSSGRSRMHLLIIIIACVIFLLIALALIVMYRTWSKRANKKMYNSMMMSNGNIVVANENAQNSEDVEKVGNTYLYPVATPSLTLEQRKSLITDPKVQIFGPPALARPRSEPDISQEITTMTTLCVV